MVEFLSLESLERKDREILFELDQNSRQPYAQIAKKLRISKENVKYRIDRMQKQGLIDSFHAYVDLANLGFSYFKYYLRFRGTSPELKEKYFSFLKEHPRIVWSIRCVGKYDSVVLYVGRDIREYYQFIQEVQEQFGQYIALLDVNFNVSGFQMPRGYLLDKPISSTMKLPTIQKKDLTRNDLTILSILSANARAPLEELAKKTNQSLPTVRKRLTELIKAGAIPKFTLKMNYPLFQYQFVKIMFRLQNVSSARRQAFYNYFLIHPNSIYLIEQVGISDVDVDWELKDIRAVGDIINELKEKFSDIITDYEILFVSREEKLNYAASSALIRLAEE